MTGPIASVVVPAHDEEDRIEATLRSVLADAATGELEVVVVCNGCTDRTAERARVVPGVRVEEVPTPSKVAALHRGDQVATAFPRVYLDADVGLSTDAVRALVSALDEPGALVAGVRPQVDLSGATLPARQFHQFRLRLPVFADGIIGAGVYALSEAGRARFGVWPDVLGDDQFVLRQFAAHERRTVAGHHSRVRVSGTLRDTVRRAVRVRRGNRQLTAGTPTQDGLPPPPAGVGTAVRGVLRQPAAWPGMLTWLAVSAWVRLRVWARPMAGGDWATEER